MEKRVKYFIVTNPDARFPNVEVQNKFQQKLVYCGFNSRDAVEKCFVHEITTNGMAIVFHYTTSWKDLEHIS